MDGLLAARIVRHASRRSDRVAQSRRADLGVVATKPVAVGGLPVESAGVALGRGARQAERFETASGAREPHGREPRAARRAASRRPLPLPFLLLVVRSASTGGTVRRRGWR